MLRILNESNKHEKKKNKQINKQNKHWNEDEKCEKQVNWNVKRIEIQLEIENRELCARISNTVEVAVAAPVWINSNAI